MARRICLLNGSQVKIQSSEKHFLDDKSAAAAATATPDGQKNE
jgi:hypothetical protein